MTRLLAILALCATFAAPVSAQGDYPSKVIRMIVGFAAGGGNDIFARMLAQKLSERTGWTVIIENKPGAGSRRITPPRKRPTAIPCWSAQAARWRSGPSSTRPDMTR